MFEKDDLSPQSQHNCSCERTQSVNVQTPIRSGKGNHIEFGGGGPPAKVGRRGFTDVTGAAPVACFFSRVFPQREGGVGVCARQSCACFSQPPSSGGLMVVGCFFEVLVGLLEVCQTGEECRMRVRGWAALSLSMCVCLCVCEILENRTGGSPSLLMCTCA